LRLMPFQLVSANRQEMSFCPKSWNGTSPTEHLSAFEPFESEGSNTCDLAQLLLPNPRLHQPHRGEDERTSQAIEESRKVRLFR